MADKKRNNASWCCDKIEELILEKKKEIEELNKEADSLGDLYLMEIYEKSLRN